MFARRYWTSDVFPLHRGESMGVMVLNDQKVGDETPPTRQSVTLIARRDQIGSTTNWVTCVDERVHEGNEGISIVLRLLVEAGDIPPDSHMLDQARVNRTNKSHRAGGPLQAARRYRRTGDPTDAFDELVFLVDKKSNELVVLSLHTGCAFAKMQGISDEEAIRMTEETAKDLQRERPATAVAIMMEDVQESDPMRRFRRIAFYGPQSFSRISPIPATGETAFEP